MNSADKYPAPGLPRPTSRLRRYAAAAGSLVLAGTLALSALVSSGGVETTEAAWTDTEHAQAAITAEWAAGGWSRATSNAYTNHSSYKYRTETLSSRRVNATTSADRLSRVDSLPAGGAAQGNRGNVDLDGWFSNFEVRTAGTNLFARPATRIDYCVQAAVPNTSPGSENGCTNSGEGSPQYVLEGAQTRAKGWGRSGGYANPRTGDAIMWMEAESVTTAAECAPNGDVVASTPTAGFAPYGSAIGIISTFSLLLGIGNAESWYMPIQIPGRNERITQWVLPNYANGAGRIDPGAVFTRVTLTSRAYETKGYALSDLYATIDQYSEDNNNEHLGSFTMVFSRSECGVNVGGINHSPLQSVFEPINPPTYPSNPGGIAPLTTPAPNPNAGGIVSASFPGPGMILQELPEDELAAAELPPMTTVTSPTEHTTAKGTTTSEPPNPDEEDDLEAEESSGSGDASSTATGKTSATATRTTTNTSPPVAQTTASQPPTTLTSTPPAIVVPDEPADLPSTARTAEVGTVELDGEELDVVVRGATAPTDARAGARVLGTWINDDSARTGDWKTFTSDDPDEDGWRWAAINQKTGTVVYIR